MVEVQFSDVDDRHPAIANLVGRGTFCALSDNKGLIAQRNGHNCIRIYITLRVPQNWVAESRIPFDQPEEARTRLLQLFPEWDEQLLDVIRLCDASFVPRPLYMLPIGHRWSTRSGVTLLGDAAHLMSPFAGAGVNLAMLDAAELALILSQSSDLHQAIGEYEEKMCSRAAKVAQKASSSLDLFISDDNAAEAAASFFRKLMAGGPPSVDS